jgi:signal peptide peptidase SppA
MTDDLRIRVPAFARLPDYVGGWSVAPEHFAGLWHLAAAIDFSRHDARQVEKPTRHVPGAAAADEDGPAAQDVLLWMSGEPDGVAPAAAVEKAAAGPGGKSVAVIKMTGLLMKSQSSMGGTSTIQLRRDVRQAAADPDVGAILLAIDSPGGTVAGTDDLAKDVAAARKQKPVWAHVEDLGASAAYWVASQAERITANSDTALVGSIGTIQVVHDYSGAAEKAGVRTLVFATGGLKGLGAMGSKVTDEQAAHVQGLVNAVQQSFDAAVQKGRGLSAKELADVRHGGVMHARQALDRRLIDAIQPLSKTLAQLAKPAGARSTFTAGPAGAPFPPPRRAGLPTLHPRPET